MSKASQVVSLFEKDVKGYLTKMGEGDWSFSFKDYYKKKLHIRGDSDEVVGRTVVKLISKNHTGSDFANDGENYLLSSSALEKLFRSEL